MLYLHIQAINSNNNPNINKCKFATKDLNFLYLEFTRILPFTTGIFISLKLNLICLLTCVVEGQVIPVPALKVQPMSEMWTMRCDNTRMFSRELINPVKCSHGPRPPPLPCPVSLSRWATLDTDAVIQGYTDTGHQWSSGHEDIHWHGRAKHGVTRGMLSLSVILSTLKMLLSFYNLWDSFINEGILLKL